MLGNAAELASSRAYLGAAEHGKQLLPDDANLVSGCVVVNMDLMTYSEKLCLYKILRDLVRPINVICVRP